MSKLLGHITDRISHLKIIRKMMLIYIIGGLIPLVLVSIFLTSRMSEMLLDRATIEVAQNTERIESRFVEMLKIASNVSNSLYLDEELDVLMKTNFKDRITIIDALNNFQQIDDYLYLYTELNSIRIYVKNESVLDSSQIIKLKKEDYESPWYKLAVEKQGKMALTIKYDPYTRKECPSLIRLMKNTSGEILGVMVINLSEAYINSIFASELYDYYMVLNNEDIIVSSDMEAEDKGAGTSKFLSFLDLAEGDSTIVIDKIKYQVFVDELDIGDIENSVKLITPIPKETLVKEMTSSQQTSIVMISASIIISLSVLYYLSNVFSGRVNAFREDMHSVAEGDFTIKSNIEGNDEIGDLSNDLNIMVDSIQKIIHNAYEVQLQKEQLAGKQKEAQFKMLASQINPHFLYNSLETIRMKAHINQQDEIAEVVKKLAKIMRRNLSIANDEVSLSNEIELIRHYLEIQQFRFGDKVSFEFVLKCDIESKTILPLLLQPIVENAFIHGLEPKIGHGHIEIYISEKEAILEVIIKDDGIGLDQKNVDKIIDKLKQNATNIDGSIGLTNVFQRLKLYYGEESDLKIESVIGSGTSVTMMLPINREVS